MSKARFGPDDLLFCPLGGSNEIGMNVNLYHYRGKWLMIDLGAGFADDHYPGVSMLAPDLSFLRQFQDDFLGVVLTHAHEDHLGSVGYLWDSLRCPIYATDFTAGLVEHKLSQAGLRGEAKITRINSHKPLSIGPFDLEFIQLTHSIPEMNAVVIKTDYGDIVHTGDWKFDPNPVISATSDIAALQRIGEKGALAMVCDSTNVFNPKHSGSEGELLESLTRIIQDQSGLVVTTMFASNVARIETLAKAAAAAGRKVALCGWSLKRIDTIARSTGYLKSVEDFVHENQIKRIARDKLMVIATGCQGEPNAQMHKIAHDVHPIVRLRPGDSVIFSSKIIPGNERKIFAHFNQLVRKGVEIFTEKDHLVHVSGHPSRQELAEMYNYVKPQIAVPVHGEPTHLHAHVKLCKELGIKEIFETQNGELIKLAHGRPQRIAQVESGYLAVDGFLLQPEKGEVMQARRKLQAEGAIFASVVMSYQGGLAAEPEIYTPGVLDSDLQAEFIQLMKDEIIDAIEDQRGNGAESTRKTVKKTIQRLMKNHVSKFPLIVVHVSMVE